MKEAGTNKEEMNAINYKMTDVYNGDGLIKYPEDLSSIAAKLWKECSINPLKAGTLMAYECTDEHIKFLKDQEEYKIMDFNNMKFNILFSIQDIMNDEKKIKFRDEYLSKIPSLEDYNTFLGKKQSFNIKTWKGQMGLDSAVKKNEP